MSRFGVCLTLVLLAGMTGCSSGPRASWDLAVTDAELAEAGLAYYWQNIVPLGPEEKIAHIWHLDENVYCLTDRNRVWVFDASTGERRWSEQLGPPRRRFFAASHADRVLLPGAVGVNVAVNAPADRRLTEYDIVIFNTVTDALVYNRASGGEPLQRIDFSRADFAANTAVACDGTRVYVGSVKGRYYALDLETGLVSWKLRTQAPISATPAIMGQTLYVASSDATIYATDIGTKNGRKIWPIPEAPQASAAFVGDVAVEDRGVFAGSQDYSVYAFEPVTGKQMWRFRCSGAVMRPVQVGKANVYACAEGDKFYAIDLATGQREK